MKVLKKIQWLFIISCLLPVSLYPVGIDDITYIPRFDLDDMG